MANRANDTQKMAEAPAQQEVRATSVDTLRDSSLDLYETRPDPNIRTFHYIMGDSGVRLQVIKLQRHEETSRAKQKFEHKFLCQGNVEASDIAVFPFKKLLQEIVNKSPLDELHKLGVIFCATSAIRYLHECGFFYRAFKSEFIFVEDDYTGRLPCLPSIVRDDRGSNTPSAEETDYLAPEQEHNNSRYDSKVDVWALGVGLAHTFSLVDRQGLNPYRQSLSFTKPRRGASHPPWKSTLIELAKACLQTEPEARPDMWFAESVLLAIMKLFVDEYKGEDEHGELTKYFNTLKEEIQVQPQ